MGLPSGNQWYESRMSVVSDSQEKDKEARAMRKWNIMFEFLDLDRDGSLKLEEFREFSTQLIKRGKVDLSSHLAKVFKSHWDRVCQAVNLPPEQLKIGRDLWMKGTHAVSKSEWFRSEFIPALSKGYFGSKDTSLDNLISLEEWRNYYTLRGARDEEFILNSFAEIKAETVKSAGRNSITLCDLLTPTMAQIETFLYNRFK